MRKCNSHAFSIGVRRSLLDARRPAKTPQEPATSESSRGAPLRSAASRRRERRRGRSLRERRDRSRLTSIPSRRARRAAEGDALRSGEEQLVVLAPGQTRRLRIEPQTRAGGREARRPRHRVQVELGGQAALREKVSEVGLQAVGDVDAGGDGRDPRQRAPGAQAGRRHPPDAPAAALRPARPPGPLPPSRPVTKIRSPGRAPRRVSARPRATAPSTASVIEVSRAALTLPPTSAQPWADASCSSPANTPSTSAHGQPRRSGQGQGEAQGPRPHGREIGEVRDQRPAPDVARALGRPAEVHALDHRVRREHHVLAGAQAQHRRVVADADRPRRGPSPSRRAARSIRSISPNSPRSASCMPPRLAAWRRRGRGSGDVPLPSLPRRQLFRKVPVELTAWDGGARRRRAGASGGVAREPPRSPRPSSPPG